MNNPCLSCEIVVKYRRTFCKISVFPVRREDSLFYLPQVLVQAIPGYCFYAVRGGDSDRFFHLFCYLAQKEAKKHSFLCAVL